MQLPLSFALPKADWRPTPVSQLPSWADAKRIAIDVECRDVDLKKLGPGTHRKRGDRIVGLAFAIEDGPAHYVPWGHEGGDNLDADHARGYVREQLRMFTGTLTGCNLGNYDLPWLWAEGFETNAEWYRSCDVADVMCCELHDRYSLDAQAARWGVPGKDPSLLVAAAKAHGVDPKKDLWRMAARYVGPYAEQDVRLPLQLLRMQERKIEEEEVRSIYDLECRITPILARVRHRGERVNVAKVHRMIAWAQAQGVQRLHYVAQQTGVHLSMEDVWSAEAMSKPLAALGIKVPQMLKPTKKDAERTLPSITGALLDRCGEVGVALGRARDMSKLLQFAHKTLAYVCPDGRVHCTFNQLRTTKGEDDSEEKGARFGRMSSDHYNKQQEPGRDDEYGEEWRDVYEAENDDEEWRSGDWSQQEPRIGVHYAEMLNLPGARELGDRYRADPTLDIHQTLADISGMARKIVKNFVNGRFYNMGDLKLCRAIGCGTQWQQGRDGVQREVPGPEGQAKIDQFNQFAPWMKLLNRECTKQAERVGHVWTKLRRKCRFPRDAHGNVDWSHKAYSRVGQGSAADQTKATLVEMERAGIQVRSIVHDEFNWSGPRGDYRDAKLARELMMDTVKFSVPMHVTIKIGHSWGKGKKMKPEELV